MTNRNEKTQRIPKRNHVAQSPLLRKGGPHQRNQSGQRQIEKRQTRRLIADAINRDLFPQVISESLV